jgi:hypothetical protein
VIKHILRFVPFSNIVKKAAFIPWFEQRFLLSTDVHMFTITPNFIQGSRITPVISNGSSSFSVHEKRMLFQCRFIYLFYLLYHDSVALRVYLRMLGDWRIINLQGYGRKCMWPNFKCYYTYSGLKILCKSSKGSHSIEAVSGRRSESGFLHTRLHLAELQIKIQISQRRK